MVLMLLTGLQTSPSLTEMSAQLEFPGVEYPGCNLPKES